MCKWRIDRLDMREEQQGIQEETIKNAVKFSELVKSVSTVNIGMERDRAGTKMMECGKQWVRIIAAKAMGKKVLVFNRAVKRWDEEVEDAKKVTREAHSRYTSRNTTVGWEEYANAGKYVKYYGEEERDVVMERCNSLNK